MQLCYCKVSDLHMLLILVDKLVGSYTFLTVVKSPSLPY